MDITGTFHRVNFFKKHVPKQEISIRSCYIIIEGQKYKIERRKTAVKKVKGKKELSKAIGQFCKQFRVEYIKKSMKDFANDIEVSVPSINAFERGCANNIQYLYYYYDQAPPLAKEYWKQNIFEIEKIMKEGN